MAVRAGIGLGINLRNETLSTPDASKEIRYRVWWALYTLEHILSTMTGRPTSVFDHACTTPLPAPVEDDTLGTEQAAQLSSSAMQKSSRLPLMSSQSGSSSARSTRSQTQSKPSGSLMVPQPLNG